MKMNFLKGVFLIAFVTLGVADMSAQSFLKKLKSAAEKVESVTNTVNEVTGGESTEQKSENDSISPKEFLEKAPSYSVKKVTETDSLGNAITNEDGTARYKYLLIDKNGKVCAPNTAKKHLNSALKSGAFILLKVGGGATAGALLGKKSSEDLRKEPGLVLA